MKKQVYEIDKNGYIKDIHVADIPDQLGSNIIKTDPPQGLYHARWTGTEWVEDMTREEIDSLKNQPQPPTDEERLEAVEAAILTIMEVL